MLSLQKYKHTNYNATIMNNVSWKHIERRAHKEQDAFVAE